MKNSVFIAQSLDGYIARADGNIDWLESVENPDNDDYGFKEFISRIDAVVIGRNTYEKVLSFGGWAYTLPVFILSTTLKSLPTYLESRARIITGRPSDVVKELNSGGFENLYIDGGKTIQGFLAEDLIDELTLTTLPVMIGGGFRLFGELPLDLRFVHERTRSFPNGMVQSRYRRNHG